MTSFHKWFNEKVESHYYTPDMPDLYRQESHFLFIADNIMTGEARHRLLQQEEDFIFHGPAFTKEATYGIMIRSSTVEAANPVYFEVEPRSDAAFVYGELYEVTPEIMCELDYYQANRLITNRKKVNTVTKIGGVETPAWMYLADTDYFVDPKAADRLQPYNQREYLWNVPVIAWNNTIFVN